MPWIESHTELLNHPKLLRLCSGLRCSINEGIGILSRFWWWSLTYAEDGDLSKFSPGELALAVGLEVENGEKFLSAMVDARFIDKAPYLRVHDWFEYAGRYLSGKYRTSNPSKLKEIEKKCKSGGRRTKVGLESVKSQTTLPTLPNKKSKESVTQNNGSLSADSSKRGKGKSGEDFRAKYTPEMVSLFWSEYPLKVWKPNVDRAFKKLNPDESLFAEIMSGLKKAKVSDDWSRDGGRYIPQPGKWLELRGWENQYRPAADAWQFAEN